MAPEALQGGPAYGGPSDRRRQVRHPVELGAVVVPAGRAAVKGRTANLSVSGARLTGLALDVGLADWQPSPVDPEALVWLSLECPGVPLPISLRARIVWYHRGDLGLAFMSPPRHTFDRLSRLVGPKAPRGRRR